MTVSLAVVPRHFKSVALCCAAALTLAAASSALAQGALAWRAFEVAMDALERNYLWDVDDTALVEGAIAGAVAALEDPFTAYTPAAASSVLEENRGGRFGGVGASFRKAAGEAALVTLVYEGMPAYSAGLRAGDLVSSVDGVDVTDLAIDELIELIRGGVGEPVTFGVARGSENLTVSVRRAVIDVPVVTAAVLPGDVGYIFIETFENRLVLSQLRDRLADLQARGATSLVLDLRGNGGGYLAQGMAVADEFLSSGQIAFTKSAGVTRVAAVADANAVDLPMVVLIDEDSASASEIVAAALQDHGRALIVGQRSFGKGVGQDLLRLPNGGELKYVTFEWLRPSRVSVHEVGVEPDVVVEVAVATSVPTGSGFPPHASIVLETETGTLTYMADAEGRLQPEPQGLVGDGVVRPGEARVDVEGDAVMRAALEALAPLAARPAG